MKRVANPTVPFLPKKDISERAEALIKQYSQEIKPMKTPPIPVDNIVERLLNYQLCYENLDDDILGCLCIKENLVVINKQANDVRFTFTCAHEIGHWALHKDYLKTDEKQIFLFDMEIKPSIICRINLFVRFTETFRMVVKRTRQWKKLGKASCQRIAR